MKVRNGFVSNSSSSSFIIGMAKVINEEKLQEILKKIPKGLENHYVLGSPEDLMNFADKLSYNEKVKVGNKELIVSTPYMSVLRAPINDNIFVTMRISDIKDTYVTYYDTKEQDWVSESEAKWFGIWIGNDEGSHPQKFRRTINFLNKFIVVPVREIINLFIDFVLLNFWHKQFRNVWWSIGPVYAKVDEKYFTGWQAEILEAFKQGSNKYSSTEDSIFYEQNITYKCGMGFNG